VSEFGTALEKAVFARLTAQVSQTPARIKIFQNVPENTPPPVLMIGDLRESNVAQKQGTVVSLDFDIVIVIRSVERRPVHARQAEVRAILHDWIPDGLPIGMVITRVRQTSSDVSLLQDGEHYYGISRFSCFASQALS
jgi:hypothetical protein